MTFSVFGVEEVVCTAGLVTIAVVDEDDHVGAALLDKCDHLSNPRYRYRRPPLFLFVVSHGDEATNGKNAFSKKHGFKLCQTGMVTSS